MIRAAIMDLTPAKKPTHRICLDCSQKIAPARLRCHSCAIDHADKQRNAAARAKRAARREGRSNG